MATLADVRDRLQPALLDRLTDDEPQSKVESEDRRVVSKHQLRQSVLRDLTWLFNSVQPLFRQVDQHPDLADTVLAFGLPPLSGQLASKIHLKDLEKTIRTAIERFEPRILPESIKVKAVAAGSVMDTHNVIQFEIRGQLWAQPVPLEVLLRTQLDLEAGQVQVSEVTPATVSSLR
jgi:type VI secretion system protein ImpF